MQEKKKAKEKNSFRGKGRSGVQKVFDRADIVIALGKAWKRRNRR
jgi:hypothetical protein